MLRCVTLPSEWKGAVRRSLLAAPMILLTGCGLTRGAGSESGAGCVSYQEARLSLPPVETITEVPEAWASWIADLDDRMTGACR
jgi:hypothetical protein